MAKLYKNTTSNIVYTEMQVKELLLKPFNNESDFEEILDTQSKALRYNEGKLEWSLVHFKSLEPMVKVLEFGAKKYSADNWKKGLDKKKILESMMRHLAALIDGENCCPESNLSHMGHIQCNAMFYNYFNEQEKVEPF